MMSEALKSIIFKKILMPLSFAIQQTNVQYTLTLKYQFSAECLRAPKNDTDMDRVQMMY
jgi:hypothetical protein